MWWTHDTEELDIADFGSQYINGISSLVFWIFHGIFLPLRELQMMTQRIL